MFLGMIAATAPTQVYADTRSAATKLKECEAEAQRILGGLSSSASNALAMTPAQVSEVNTRGPPKMGSFDSVEGPCSTTALRTAAETLAKSAPSGLNRQQLEKLEAAPKRIVEAREAIVEANSQKMGARLFGAVKKYVEATNSLLLAAPWPPHEQPEAKMSRGSAEFVAKDILRRSMAICALKSLVILVSEVSWKPAPLEAACCCLFDAQLEATLDMCKDSTIQSDATWVGEGVVQVWHDVTT